MAQVKVGDPLADAKAKRAAAKAATDYMVGIIKRANAPIVEPTPGGFSIVHLNADGSDFVETPAIGPDTVVDDGLPDPNAPAASPSPSPEPPATNG